MATNYRLAIKYLDSQTPFQLDGDPEDYSNITFTSGTTYTEAELDIAWAALEALPPREDFIYQEEDNESSTTSTKSWVKKLSRDFTSDAGDYLVEWRAEGRAKKNNTKAYVKCDIDDSISINDNEVLVNTGNTSIGGFKKVTLTAGAHNVSISFKASSSKKAMYIQNTRLKVIPV